MPRRMGGRWRARGVYFEKGRGVEEGIGPDGRGGAVLAERIEQTLGAEQQLLRVAEDRLLLLLGQDGELLGRSRVHAQHRPQVGHVVRLGAQQLAKARLGSHWLGEGGVRRADRRARARRVVRAAAIGGRVVNHRHRPGRLGAVGKAADDVSLFASAVLGLGNVGCP